MGSQNQAARNYCLRGMQEQARKRQRKMFWQETSLFLTALLIKNNC
jgi:hypothetical protein